MDFSNKQGICVSLKKLKHFYISFLNKKVILYFTSNFRIFFSEKNTKLRSKTIRENLHNL